MPRKTPLQKRIGRRNYGYVNVAIRGRKRPKKASLFVQAFGPTLNPSVYSNASTSSNFGHGNVANYEPPQSYNDARRQLSDDWRSMEPKLIEIAMLKFKPSSQKCGVCQKTCDEILRCEDCGIPIHFCQPCWVDSHRYLWYHMPDIFKNGMFVKHCIPSPVMKRQDEHNCGSKYTKKLTVFDPRGCQHDIDICFCNCESESETLLRFNLWGSSIKSPQVAIHVSLLEWFRVLQLEQQISTNGFCNALNCRFSLTPGYKPKIQHLSKIMLREVVESYRYYVYQLEYVQSIEESKMDDGSSCPACFENSPDENMHCIDANFGLVRRTAAGVESYPPHHQNLFFQDQTKVDEYVNAADSQSKELFSNCSNFQAGDEVRSRGKNKKLDVKGVIGTCCKHDFPGIFVNLKHGERFAYSVWLIKQLLQSNAKLKIFYDIACKLQVHLQNKQEPGLLDSVLFAVPVFHGYAHSMDCQLKFNPRMLSGFGLMEGEGVERLWSYLRKFHKVTKEMKPEHRHDLLTAALLHYGSRLKLKLGSTLTKRLERAISVQSDGQVSLQAILTTTSQPINESDDIQRQHRGIACDKLTWEEDYAKQLHLYYREKLNEMLKRIEHKHSTARWTAWDPQFLHFRASAVLKLRETLLSRAEKENVERIFFSSLIKKYPMGQAICNRLMRGQKKVSRNMRKIIASYNEWQDVQGGGTYPQKIQWCDITESTNQSPAPLSALQKLHNIRNMISRSGEEIDYIKSEMLHTLHFYQAQVHYINQLRLQSSTDHQAYLKACAFQMETQLQRLHLCFRSHVPHFHPDCPVLTEISSFPRNTNDDLSSFSDSDCSSAAADSSENSESEDEAPEQN